MGTTYAIKVSGLPENTHADELQKDIEALLQQLSRSMSTYLPESEIARFNRFQETTPFPVSSAMAAVVAEALRVSRLTNGALDISVAPLVNLWGFGADASTSDIPGEEAILSLKKQIGYQKIEVRHQPPSIIKSVPEVTIDLSAVAKGFAVDEVALLLESNGVANYLVEIGGEIRTAGLKAKGSPWIVGIERPVAGKREVHRIVSLVDQAMATSGDYRNYFEKNGKRFSHLINPVTGKPIDHRLASVSIIHPSCMTADAMATAFMILGAEEAYGLALKEQLAAYFVVRTDTGFEERTTPAFNTFMIKN